MDEHVILKLPGLSPAQVVGTLLHEDQHLLLRDRTSNILVSFEANEQIPDVRQPWLSEPSGPSLLLEELQAHGVYAQFQLYLWDTLGFEPKQHLNDVWVILKNLQLARQAIRLLKRRVDRGDLNEEGQAWLTELEALWMELVPQARPRVDQVLEVLLNSEDRTDRWGGYDLLARGFRMDPGRKKRYSSRFDKAIDKETDLGLLRGLKERFPSWLWLRGSVMVRIFELSQKGPHPAGLEERSIGLERQINQTLAVLAETKQGRGGVLAIEASVVSQRVGLEEFVARLPRGIGKVVLVGGDSAAAKEAAARNPSLLVVDSDNPVDWAVTLAGLEEADHVLFLGDPGRARILSRLLPPSMVVTPIDPAAGLEQILLAMGIPRKVLDQVNAAGLEEQLERLHAA